VLNLKGVKKFMNRLERVFYESGHDATAFTLKSVRRARKGIKATISQREQAIAREKNQQDPVTIDVLWTMLKLCDLDIGPPAMWGKQIWYRFLAFLGGMTAFQLALRLSEYCHTAPKKRQGEVKAHLQVLIDENTLRPDDVSFRLKDGTVYGAVDVQHYANLRLDEVDTILFKLRGAKNIVNGVTEVISYPVGTTWWLDKLIGLHLTFCIWSRWEPGDIYFSMRFPLGRGALKRLVASMVIDLERAAVVELGGNPDRYSTISFKTGSMTSLYFAGATEEELRRNGRHASVAANRHYRRNLVPGVNARAGALGSTGATALGIGDVQRARQDIVPRAARARPY
jgi:hypothetical protein